MTREEAIAIVRAKWPLSRVANKFKTFRIKSGRANHCISDFHRTIEAAWLDAAQRIQREAQNEK